ncbi:type III PLP-dependent enzyme [Streptomyces celluloflavus]|uniref:type III PLP-dependent enzyme n=1 Tax=Streptomyces celluloflavus TaxID=58344 RepID=UPI0036C62184
MTYENTPMFAALAAAAEDRIIFDLAGIEDSYDTLLRELPGLSVRFAMKACPVDEVLSCLADKGAGFDAASPHEIAQALRTGVPVERIHYGNTIKSDRHIIEAYRLGIRDFATDSLEDVTAIARHAPGARVFCRLATEGDGALWGLGNKFGCSPADAVRVLETARETGLTPSGLSVHVGSQQMTAEAWRSAVERLADVLEVLDRRGISLDHVNLGGGLPALGYLDKRGRALDPPTDKIFAVIREGMQQLREIPGHQLDFIVEPGRYLVADHGAIRAHVSRLSARQKLNGERQYWLYLSCGKFNGLYEMDELQYRLIFPSHLDAASVPAVVAGPTCDSDDAYAHEHGLVQVPRAAASGDPVWVLSCGAYATSYMTQGFNGFTPLPYTCVPGEGGGPPGPRHQVPPPGAGTPLEGARK